MKKNITSQGFRGEYRFLSNFWPAVVIWEGIKFQTVENAYQASKTSSEKLWRIISELSPSDAKTVGQNIKTRPEWNDHIRIETMRELLYKKFDPEKHPELAQKLLSTGDMHLVEVNTWDDTFFGVCDGAGENHLGKLLMEVRDYLQERS